MRSLLSRRTVVAVVLFACGWSALVAWRHLNGEWRGEADTLIERADALAFDLVHQLYPARGHADVVVVRIDAATIDRFGEAGRLTRPRIAELVAKLWDAQVKTLAVDVLFAGSGSIAADLTLARALNGGPSVIAAALVADEAGTRIVEAAPLVRGAALSGTVNIATDVRGAPHALPLLIEANGAVLSALPMAAAALFREATPQLSSDTVAIGEARIALDGGGRLPLRSLPRVDRVSAACILVNDCREAVRGQLVFVGYDAPAVGDRFPSPFSRSVAGVEVLAGAASQLLGEARLIRNRSTAMTTAVAGIVLALVGAGLFVLLPVGTAALCTLATFAVWIATVAALMAFDWAVSPLVPIVAAAPPALVAAVASLRAHNRHEAELSRSARSLSAYLPAGFADLVVQGSERIARPRTVEATVLFADIASHTEMVHDLGPEHAALVIEAFQQLVAEAALPGNGVVMNYMGDGALVAFGLLDDEPCHAGSAAAAIAATERLRREATELLSEIAGRTMYVRCGIACGPVMVSTTGHDRYRQIGLTGDAVNLASRLQDVAKEEGAAVAAHGLPSDGSFAADGLSAPDRRVERNVRSFEETMTILLWNRRDGVATR